MTTGVAVMVSRLPNKWRALVTERFMTTARDLRRANLPRFAMHVGDSIPLAPNAGRTLRVADGAVDIVRDRFGWEAVGFGSVALGLSCSVPDEFRELAESEL